MIKPVMYANLHNHSTHSDGVYSPEELVRIAAKEGYGAIAMTDHDTVTANSETARACIKKDMENLFGCEFMTRSLKTGIPYHLTSFDFDSNSPEMKDYLEKCSFTMTEKTRIIFNRGQECGLLTNKISWEEVIGDNPGISWLCNDHVFASMKRRGLAEDKDYPEFYEGIFVKHGYGIPPAYEKLPLEEIIPLIKRAGGLVIVAHPHNQLDTIPYLKELGVDGIEVWHPDLSREEIPLALKIARDNDLLVSGGPDHSGLSGGQYKFYEDYKSCPWYIPEFSMGTTKELFTEIKERRLMEGRRELLSEYIEYYDHQDL